MKIRLVDLLFAASFGSLAVWVIAGFFQRDPALHNVELVPSYFTRAIQLAVFLAAIGFLVACGYVYCLIRNGEFQWRKIGFPGGAILVGLFVVYVPISYVYERTLMVREQIHPFLQLFPETVPDELAKRAEDEKVIVCLGGSTTAWGDQDYRKWTQLLERNLRAKGHSIRVLNQGRPWFTSLHSLYNYQTNVRHIRPDVLIVMHAINDLTMNADHSYFSSGKFRPDYGHNLGPFARLHRTQPLFDLTIEVARRSWYAPQRLPLDTDVFPGLESFHRNLSQIVMMAQRDGTQVVLMTQGSLYKKEMPVDEIERLYLTKRNSAGDGVRWSIATALSGMQQYNATTENIATQHGAQFVDLASVLPKTLDYFNDDCHYRGPAIDKISDAVTKSVEPMLQLQP